MEPSTEQYESLNQSIEEYERKARRRAWVSSLIPLFFGAVLLAYTVWQINNYGKILADVRNDLEKTSQELIGAQNSLVQSRNELEEARSELAQTRSELAATEEKLSSTQEELEAAQTRLEDLRKQLEQISEQLRDTNLYIEKNVEVDLFALKEGPDFGPTPGVGDVLSYVLNLQLSRVRWNPIGFSVEEGFDSPSFAIHVLQECGLYTGPADSETRPWNLAVLGGSIPRPSNGDLVYYLPSGFAMFYYELDGRNFVIGMTPVGILAMEPDFAPNPAYLRIPYENYQSCFD